ncbi:hypothetical protein BH11PSE11_BH11PSE11_04840 [soil metagenome]
MNETANTHHMAAALLRPLPKKNTIYDQIADYSATILALSSASMRNDLSDSDVNNINMFLKGFVSFCAAANELSQEDADEAYETFFMKITNCDFVVAALQISLMEEMMKTRNGTALFKAGRMAAWECQQGNTEVAIAALGKAIGA